MNRISGVLAAMVFSLGMFTDAVAQAAFYNLETPIRYQETTSSEIEVEGPMGPIVVSSTHDATISIYSIAPDTVFASFEALELTQSGPEGDISPNTQGALNKAFMLHFPSNGKVRTLMSPSFSKTIEDASDLTLEFFDFFLPLPEDALDIDTEWSSEYSETNQKGQKLTRKGIYKVIGDTLINGKAAKIVDAVIEANAAIDTFDDESGTKIKVDLEGEELSRFYFSVQEGKMLGRDRKGALSGAMTFGEGAQSMTMNQNLKSIGRIRLVD